MASMMRDGDSIEAGNLRTGGRKKTKKKFE